jgi:hypothetical protein
VSEHHQQQQLAKGKITHANDVKKKKDTSIELHCRRKKN